MRRLSVLVLLLLASCSYRPAFVDGPPVQGGIGSSPSTIRQQRQRGMQVCREISRTRCDVTTCKGKNLDLVTLSCGGGQVTRCELGKGGC